MAKRDSKKSQTLHTGKKLGYVLVGLFFGLFVLAWTGVASIGFKLLPHNIVSVNPLMLGTLVLGFGLLYRYRNTGEPSEQSTAPTNPKPLQMKQALVMSTVILLVSVALLIRFPISFETGMLVVLWISIGLFIMARRLWFQRVTPQTEKELG